MDEDGVVYVIDDDAGVRTALTRLLSTTGREVVSFPTGQAFLDSAPSRHPACVVLDLRMPGVGGLELQARLGQDHDLWPIIFLTGHANVPASVRALKGGAVDFLQKPVDEHDLLAAVDRALALSREAMVERAERDAIQRRLDTLTPRERQVLERVIAGMLNKQIAYDLGAAEKTIKVHRGRVMDKMGAGSVPELVRMAARVGLRPRTESTT